MIEEQELLDGTCNWSRQGQVPRILVVEDDAGMRSMMGEALTQEGYCVNHCSDGFEWLNFIAHHYISEAGWPIDLVVSDIRMPRMNGTDAFAVLCDVWGSEKHPPVIFITAFGDVETHLRAEDLGAAAVMDKPFGISDLLELVRSIIPPHAAGQTPRSACRHEGERDSFGGSAVSAGLGIGMAWPHRDKQRLIENAFYVGPDEHPAEYHRIQWAISAVRAQLERREAEVRHNLDDEFARVFQVQRELLKDAALHDRMQYILQHKCLNAEWVVRACFGRFENDIRGAGQGTHTAIHPDDISDLCRQVLRMLAGEGSHHFEHLPETTVLVANQLLPSDVVHFSRRRVRGVVLESGAPMSHTAIMLRELGIPAVSEVKQATRRIPSGAPIIVDGTDGKVIVNPNAQDERRFRERQLHSVVTQAFTGASAREPAQTLDGTVIAVTANVGSRGDSETAVEHGADGVGLYRMESLYFARESLPTVDDVLSEMHDVLAPFNASQRVTVRLLDTGGEKTLPFLNHGAEPAAPLGRRGARMLLQYPRLLRAQLEAVLMLSRERDIQIVVPMLRLPSDMDEIRQAYESIANELGYASRPLLGAMIETPAAALCAAEIAQYSDFLSIGTNDLTQFTMAAGRENADVSSYQRQDHPAVLRILKNVLADAGSLPVSICGELASEPDKVAMLLSVGIRELSVRPYQIPLVKQAVRETNLSFC